MTEEERHYKILKKTSYEEQLSEEDKYITKRGICLTLAATATICAFLAVEGVDSMTPRLIYTSLGLLNVGLATKDIKEIMDTISTKTMLKNRIEDIDTELAMDDIEEGRGFRR